MEWRYSGKVLRVVDGDTVDLRLALTPHRIVKDGSFYHDLGFHIYAPLIDADRPIVHDIRVRLADINAPEVRGEEKVEGTASKYALQNELPVETQVIVATVKVGKYGRYIAHLWKDDVHINQWMVDNGHAEVHPDADIVQRNDRGSDVAGVIGDRSSDGD